MVIFTISVQTNAESENSMTITISPTQFQATCIPIQWRLWIKACRKNKYTMQKLSYTHRFTTMAEMKLSLSSYLKFEVRSDNFGYIHWTRTWTKRHTAVGSTGWRLAANVQSILQVQRDFVMVHSAIYRNSDTEEERQKRELRWG